MTTATPSDIDPVLLLRKNRHSRVTRFLVRCGKRLSVACMLALGVFYIAGILLLGVYPRAILMVPNDIDHYLAVAAAPSLAMWMIGGHLMQREDARQGLGKHPSVFWTLLRALLFGGILAHMAATAIFRIVT